MPESLGCKNVIPEEQLDVLVVLLSPEQYPPWKNPYTWSSLFLDTLGGHPWCCVGFCNVSVKHPTFQILWSNGCMETLGPGLLLSWLKRWSDTSLVGGGSPGWHCYCDQLRFHALSMRRVVWRFCHKPSNGTSPSFPPCSYPEVKVFICQFKIFLRFNKTYVLNSYLKNCNNK